MRNALRGWCGPAAAVVAAAASAGCLEESPAGRCETVRDCDFMDGEDCIMGRCRVPECTDASDCTAGGERCVSRLCVRWCDDDAECDWGETCVSSSPYGVCVDPYGMEYGSCVTYEDCEYGDWCQTYPGEGYCLPGSQVAVDPAGYHLLLGGTAPVGATSAACARLATCICPSDEYAPVCAALAAGYYSDAGCLEIIDSEFPWC